MGTVDDTSRTASTDPATPDVHTDLVATLRAAGCVFAEEEAAVIADAAPPGPEREALLARRVAGEPLEHVVGHVEFDGQRVLLGPGVFVPRQRSVLLVELAASQLTEREGLEDEDDPPVLVDLCCGSGALALAVATRHRGVGGADLVVHASELDPAAADWARRNLAPVGGVVHTGHLDEALPDSLVGTVDVMVANVPYVPTEQIDALPLEAREHEPRVALDGGPDGLDVLREVAARSVRWLRPGGVLISEIADDQAEAAQAALASAGLRPSVVATEEATAVVATYGHAELAPPGVFVP